MKKTISIIAIFISCIAIMAFTSLDKTSEGAIGDVKYSVLPPDKFQEENGSGWVLMDERIPLKNSALKTKHGITELPDARGLFIRTLNSNRADGKGDTFQQENGRERLMGEYQGDQFSKHNHPMNYELGRSDTWGGGWGSGAGGQTAVNSPGTTKHVNNEVGGAENRPKSIALYTYVKINE
ncbi:hypothetical protein [Dyadobacter sp. 32]|uniref:hypothetical protein n=1 Tax=Dyadobacter sp. 32 TaxID=538966 RepID=UPI0011ECA4B4